MYNLNIDQIVASYNASFSINTAVLYASIEDGSYDQMGFNGAEGLYAVSNRKAQICHMFRTLPQGVQKEVMTKTKGYAVAKVVNLEIEYKTQKANVAKVSEVELLRAQVKELQNEVTNRDSIIATLEGEIVVARTTIANLSKGIKLYAKGVVTTVIKAVQ
jgi:hypothetical protein